MTQALVRTRGTVARLSVTCQGGQPHSFSITADGEVSNPHHDAEQDAVMLALGAERHNCARVELAFQVAQICYDASVGVRDVPKARHLGRGWITEGRAVRCPNCRRTGNTVGHVSSLMHLLNDFGVSDLKRQAGTLLAWLHRVKGPSTVLTGQSALDGLLEGESSTWLTPHELMTPEFVRLAVAVLPHLSGFDLVRMRDGGVRLDWLADLLPRLTAVGRRHLAEAEHTDAYVAALTGARNLPAQKVASFLNAGVRSNIYTYIKENISPEDALAVYRANEGQTNVRALMAANGLSAAQVVSRTLRNGSLN